MELDDLDMAFENLAKTQVSEPTNPAAQNSSESSVKSFVKNPAESISDTANTAHHLPPPIPGQDNQHDYKTTEHILTGPLPTEWSGRQTFDDLFVPDATNKNSAAMRGSADDKIEFFRDKLKRAELQIGRFRNAWHVRERELDTLESLWSSQHKKVQEQATLIEELQKKLAHIEHLVEQKRHEFEVYGQKVASALAQKEAQEKTLKETIEQQQASHAHLEALQATELQTLQTELIQVQTALQEEQQLRLNQENLAQEQLHNNNLALQDTQNQLNDALAQQALLRQELLQNQESFAQDLATRDEALSNLRDVLEKQRTAMLERDQQIDQLNNNIHTLGEQAALEQTQAQEQIKQLQQQQQQTTTMLQLQIDETESQYEEKSNEFLHNIQMRDEAIEKLKNSLENERRQKIDIQASLEQTTQHMQKLQNLLKEQQIQEEQKMLQTKKVLQTVQNLLS